MTRCWSASATSSPRRSAIAHRLPDGGDEFAMLIRGDAEAAAVVEAGAEALSEWGQAGGQPLPRTDLTLRAKSPVVKHIGSANSSIVSDPSQL